MLRASIAGWILVLCCVPAVLAGVEMRVEPGRDLIRPYQSVPIQIRYSAADRMLSGTLPEPGSIRLADHEGGWLSRPFRYPGGDSASPAHAVLYTAPERPGRYIVEARIKGQRLHVEIAVSPSAPPERAGESIAFGPESPARDFYRDLAEHYAPVFCQETWFDPKADYLARFDYDGDWRGDNNWDNAVTGSSQAYVYYAAMETATHYFLVYDLFHPRHYSDDCSGGACSENDSTGLVLTIRKDGSKHGRLQVMETTGRGAIYSYVSDSRIRDGAHHVAGEVRLWRESHPVVFVEAGSHTLSSAADALHSAFILERMDFSRSTGVIYRFGGAAGRPKHPNDREVSYDLLSAADYWWRRAISPQGREARMFDEYFRYAPPGARPRASAEEIPGAFYGRKYAANQARPFWAWSDSPGSRKSPGQWALDPAYAVSVNLKFPGGTPFSPDYIFNPYLERGNGGRRESLAAAQSLRKPEPEGAVTVSQAPAPASSRSATGPRQALSPPAEKPNYRLKDKHGQLEFRARVDGNVYLYIRGDQIEVEYASGRPMDEIRYRFSQPLPAQELDEVKLEDVEGRGTIRLLEWPNSGNEFTAKVRILDDKPGASSYRFRLAWKR